MSTRQVFDQGPNSWWASVDSSDDDDGDGLEDDVTEPTFSDDQLPGFEDVRAAVEEEEERRVSTHAIASPEREAAAPRSPAPAPAPQPQPVPPAAPSPAPAHKPTSPAQGLSPLVEAPSVTPTFTWAEDSDASSVPKAPTDSEALTSAPPSPPQPPKALGVTMRRGQAPPLPQPSTADAHLNLSPERRKSWLERAHRRKQTEEATQRFRKPDTSDPSAWLDLADAWVSDLYNTDSMVALASMWNRIRRALSSWQSALLDGGASTKLLQQAIDLPPPNETRPGHPRSSLSQFIGITCNMLGEIRGQVHTSMFLTGPGSHLDVALQSRDMAVAQRRIASEDAEAAAARLEDAEAVNTDLQAQLQDAEALLRKTRLEFEAEKEALQSQLTTALRNEAAAKLANQTAASLKQQEDSAREASAAARAVASARRAPATATDAVLTPGDFETPARRREVVVHSRSSRRRTKKATPAAEPRGRSALLRVKGGHNRSSSSGPAVGRAGFGSSSATGRLSKHLPWERNPDAPTPRAPSPAPRTGSRLFRPTASSASKLRRPRASSAEPARRRPLREERGSPGSVREQMGLAGPIVLQYHRHGKLRDSFESKASETSQPVFGSSNDRFAPMVGSGVDLKRASTMAPPEERKTSVASLIVDPRGPTAGAVQREQYGSEPRVLSRLNAHGVVDRKGHVPVAAANSPAALAHRAPVVRPTSDTKLW